MYYVSTRDASLRYTAAQTIVQGLSREGGLFLPSEIPAAEPRGSDGADALLLSGAGCAHHGPLSR